MNIIYGLYGVTFVLLVIGYCAETMRYLNVMEWDIDVVKIPCLSLKE